MRATRNNFIAALAVLLGSAAAHAKQPLRTPEEAQMALKQAFVGSRTPHYELPNGLLLGNPYTQRHLEDLNALTGKGSGVLQVGYFAETNHTMVIFEGRRLHIETYEGDHFFQKWRLAAWGAHAASDDRVSVGEMRPTKHRLPTTLIQLNEGEVRQVRATIALAMRQEGKDGTAAIFDGQGNCASGIARVLGLPQLTGISVVHSPRLLTESLLRQGRGVFGGVHYGPRDSSFVRTEPAVALPVALIDQHPPPGL